MVRENSFSDSAGSPKKQHFCSGTGLLAAGEGRGGKQILGLSPRSILGGGFSLLCVEVTLEIGKDSRLSSTEQGIRDMQKPENEG